MIWSGEWVNGTGKSTGEETEQLFSFLSRFGNTTKHQSPENREETITEMVFAWNKRKILKTSSELRRRYIKNESELAKTTDALKIIKNDMNVDCDETIVQWLEEIQKCARGIKNTRHRKLLSDVEKALLLIDNLQDSSYASLINSSMVFLKQIKSNLYYRLLEFDRARKDDELARLLPQITETSLKEAYRSLLHDIWKPLLEQQIEKLFLEKVVIGSQIKKVADTSKRRHVMRGKQATVNKKIKDILDEYCLLFSLNVKTVFESCEKGVFAWQNVHDVSITGSAVDRRVCVEKWLRQNHFLEERVILQNEMKNCLKFYHDKITMLTAKLDHTRAKGSTVEIQSAEEEQPSEDGITEEYSSNELQRRSYKGELMLVRLGIWFYRNQMEKAIEDFRSIIDSTGYIPTNLLDIDSSEISHSVEEEGGDGVEDGGDVEDVDEPEELENTIDQDDVNIIRDFIVNCGEELAMRYKFDDCHTIIRNGCQNIFLPETCCQSKLNGSNGSSACVIIALLMGYLVRGVKSTMDIEILFNRILPLFCGAIDIGNYLYERCGAMGLLYVEEAISALPTSIDVHILEETNVHIKGSGENTLFSYFQNMDDEDIHCFYVLVIKEKAFSIFPSRNGITVIDTHCHGRCHGWLDICA